MEAKNDLATRQGARNGWNMAFFEFASGMLKGVAGPLIEVGIAGQGSVVLQMKASHLNGNTINREALLEATWSFAFAPNAAFSVSAAGPTPPRDGTRDGGTSAGVGVQLPIELLPVFLALLGPSMNGTISFVLSPTSLTVTP
ncbi:MULTISPECIES: hypothetical protein [Sorangium]|uniref:Uncharacterized protein n=1 Tax=Sorangium cellulosum (strain So ce56) TaxID=448385 RepID=A9GRM3_SORC5|nr:hypothetical protein [Sorangium cellulosum]CAN93644.1 hypothetical protein predicted by Glimmer/Critica [Sorangium cellulosum So ce56]